jgi:Flp pilus assembly protein TadB
LVNALAETSKDINIDPRDDDDDASPPLPRPIKNKGSISPSVNPLPEIRKCCKWQCGDCNALAKMDKGSRCRCRRCRRVVLVVLVVVFLVVWTNVDTSGVVGLVVVVVVVGLAVHVVDAVVDDDDDDDEEEYH